MTDTRVRAHGSRLQMPRSRGATSGFLQILLGVWGAFVPFVGPYFHFAFTPDDSWTWTGARGWLEVLPGAATIVGGLLLLGSRNRATAMLGGWLTVVAGAWFVIGRVLAGPLGLGSAGVPVAVTASKVAWLELTYFSGLGVVIVFLGAAALGRLSVRSARDIAYESRPLSEPAAVTDSRPAAEPAVVPEHVPTADREPRAVPAAAEAEPAAASTERASTDRVSTEPVSTERASTEPELTEPDRRRRPWGGIFGRGRTRVR